MNKHNELINRAQEDLNEFGQVSAVTAQALIDALIAATGDKVFVCNGGEPCDHEHTNILVF